MSTSTVTPNIYKAVEAKCTTFSTDTGTYQWLYYGNPSYFQLLDAQATGFSAVFDNNHYVYANNRVGASYPPHEIGFSEVGFALNNVLGTLPDHTINSVVFNVPITGLAGTFTLDVYKLDSGVYPIDGAYYSDPWSLVYAYNGASFPSNTLVGSVSVTANGTYNIPISNLNLRERSQYVLRMREVTNHTFPANTTPNTLVQVGATIGTVTVTVDYGASLYPSAPTGITITGIDCDSATVSFTPPTPLPGEAYYGRWNVQGLVGLGGAGGYGGPMDTSFTVGNNASSIVISGIDAKATAVKKVTGNGAKSVYVAIYSSNGGMYTSAEAFGNTTQNVIACAVAPTIPPAPATLSVTMGATTANMSWPTVAGATGFKGKWYLTAAGGSSVPLQNLGNVQTYQATGLTASSAYTFEVYAYNAQGNSATPATASGTTSSSATAPPTALMAVTGDKQVTLNWTASPTTGASYEITMNPGNVVTPLSATSKVIAGLTNGTQYTFSVVAIFNGSKSSAAGPITATPSAAPPVGRGVFDYVIGVNEPTGTLGYSDSSFIIGSWKYRDGVAQPIPTGYYVLAFNSLSSPPVWTKTVNAWTPDSQQCNGSHCINIQSSVAASTYIPIDTHAFTNASAAPFIEVLPLYADGNYGPALSIQMARANLSGSYVAAVETLTAVSKDSGADLAWTVGSTGTTPIRFYISIFHDGYRDDALSQNFNVGGSARSITLNGLTNGKHYTIAVQGMDNNGNLGPPANVVDIYPVGVANTPPPVDPATLSLISHQNSLDATWVASLGATKYEVSYSLAPAGPFTNAIVLTLAQLMAVGGSYSYTIPGLASSTTYYVRVKAGNVSSSGADQWSTPGAINHTTTLSTVGFDAVPVNTSASSASPNSITVVWSTPISHGTAALTQYQVSYKKSGDTTYNTVTVTATTSPSNNTTIIGLKDNTSYAFHIVATNAASETSPQISDVTINTLATNTVTKPNPVKMLTGIEGDTLAGSVEAPYTFTWSDSLDETLQSYNLYILIWNIDTITGDTIGDPFLQLFNTTLNNYTVLAPTAGVRVQGYVTVLATRVVSGVDRIFESDASNNIIVVAIDDKNSDIRTANVSAYAFYDLDNTTVPNLLLATRIRKQFSSNIDITTLNKIDVENSLYNPLDLLIEKIDATSGFDREFIFSTTSYDIKVNNWQYVNEVGFAYLPIPDYGIPVATFLTLNKTDEPMGMFKATNPCSYKITSMDNNNIFAENDKIFLSKESYRTINGTVDRVLASVPLTNGLDQTTFTNMELNASYDSVAVIDSKTSILPLRFLMDVDRNTITQTKLPSGHNNILMDRKLNADTGQCGGISAIIKYIEKRAPRNFTLEGFNTSLYLSWEEPRQPSLILKRYEISGYFFQKDPVTNVTRKRFIGTPDVDGNFVPYIPISADTIPTYVVNVEQQISTFKYIKEEDTSRTILSGTIDPNIFYTMQINAVYDYRGNEVVGPKTYELSMKTANIPSEVVVKANLTGIDVVWPVVVNTYFAPGTTLPVEDHFARLTLVWNGQRKEILWRDLINYSPVGSVDVAFPPQLFTLADTITYINNYIITNYPTLNVAARQSGTQLEFYVTDAGLTTDDISVIPEDLVAPISPDFVIPGGLSILGKSPTYVDGGPLPKVFAPDPPRNTNIFVGKDNLWVDWKEPENNGGSPIYKYVVDINGDSSPSTSFTVYKDQNLVGVKHYRFDLSSVGPVLPNTLYTVNISAYNSQLESLHASLGPVQVADVVRWTKVDFNSAPYVSSQDNPVLTSFNERNQLVARPVTGQVPETYNVLYKQENAKTADRNLIDNQPWQYAEERLTVLPRVNFDAIETQQPIGIHLNNKNIQPGSLTLWYANNNTAVLSDVGNGKLVDAAGDALIRPAYTDECGDLVPAQKVGLVDYENGIISCYIPQLKNSNVLITYRYKEVSVNPDDYSWFSTPLFDLEVKTQLFPLTYPHLTYILKNVNRLRPANTVVRNFTVK